MFNLLYSIPIDLFIILTNFSKTTILIFEAYRSLFSLLPCNCWLTYLSSFSLSLRGNGPVCPLDRRWKVNSLHFINESEEKKIMTIAQRYCLICTAPCTVPNILYLQILTTAHRSP